jgi:hypothetical protein
VACFASAGRFLFEVFFSFLIFVEMIFFS